MIHNSTIDLMLNRKSIRKYKADMPSDEILETIVRAGMQAPFASQMYSVLLSRDTEENIFKAPWQFVICVDSHKFELIMAKRGWKMVTNDLFIMVLGIQDGAYMAENMVMAAESLGMGSCFLGFIPYMADKIKEQYQLPDRIFPLVGLTMGYPDEDFPPRPRYPMEYVLFEDKYPELNDEAIEKAMKDMDEGYLKQEYYKKLNAKIDLEGDRKENFDYKTYSWTEHISRKWGQWNSSPEKLLEQFKKCGFEL